jgi:hypothetical protein
MTKLRFIDVSGSEDDLKREVFDAVIKPELYNKLAKKYQCLYHLSLKPDTLEQS